MIICDENRYEYEREYVSLILNKEDIIPILQLDYTFLHDPENQKVMKAAVECYKKYGTINALKMKEFCDYDFDTYYFLWKETLSRVYEWEKQLPLCEQSILKYYKEDNIKRLNEQLDKREISYDDFITKLEEIKSYELQTESSSLTVQEIKDNIDNRVLITLNKFPKLSNSLQLAQGDFLVIGANTGTGKSSFMLNLMEDLMDRYQCIYFNMEMSKSTIYKRLISIKGDIPIYEIVKQETPEQRKLIEKAMEDIEKSNVIVEHLASSIKQIRSVVKKNKAKNKHTIVFLDHLGLIGLDEKSKNIYETATEVAKKVRQMCLEEDCTFIGASQLNRDASKNDTYDLSALKDSGEVENSASKILMIHRPPKLKDGEREPDEVETIIEIKKNREGRLGGIAMHYNKAKQIFRENYL